MSGAEKLLLAAIAVQVGLTLWLAIALSVMRLRMVMSGQVRIAEVALDAGNWPDRARQYGNAFANQFQLPVLFYAAALLALTRHGADMVVASLAVGFVALRLLHAGVHVTSNAVVRRFQIFNAGLAVLALLWIYVLARLYLPG